MHATLANVTRAVEASGAGWEVASANETRVGAVVPNFSAAGERARRIWLAVRVTMSPATSKWACVVRAEGCAVLVRLRRRAEPLSPGPRQVWRARTRQRSSTVRRCRAFAAYVRARSRNTDRTPASVVDRVPALLLSAEAVQQGSPAKGDPECGSTKHRRQNTNSGAVIGLTPPIAAGVAWRRAPPSRPASRPQGLTEIVHETASRIEQLG